MSQRLDAATRFYGALRTQVLIGAADAERARAWSQRVLEADRTANPESGAEPYARHVQRMERLVVDLEARPRTARATDLERGAAEFAVVEGKLWVAGAKGESVDQAVFDRRMALAKDMHKAAQKAFELGEVDVEPPYAWSCRWLEADRAQDEARAVLALEQHLSRILRLEGSARTRKLRNCLKRPSDLPASEFFRWEGEFYVLAARPSQARDADRRRQAFLDAWFDAALKALDASMAELRAGKGDVERAHTWSLRLLDVERAKGPDASAASSHLQRVQRLEKEVRGRDDGALGLSLPALEVFRLEAESRRAQA